MSNEAFAYVKSDALGIATLQAQPSPMYAFEALKEELTICAQTGAIRPAALGHRLPSVPVARRTSTSTLPSWQKPSASASGV